MQSMVVIFGDIELGSFVTVSFKPFADGEERRQGTPSDRSAERQRSKRRGQPQTPQSRERKHLPSLAPLPPCASVWTYRDDKTPVRYRSPKVRRLRPRLAVDPPHELGPSTGSLCRLGCRLHHPRSTHTPTPFKKTKTRKTFTQSSLSLSLSLSLCRRILHRTSIFSREGSFERGRHNTSIGRPASPRLFAPR